MRQQYKMSQKLTTKLFEYLALNGSKKEHLSPEEENSISLKLNEELREGTIILTLETKNQNMLSIIKSSIFFVCRWSKLMQLAASRKL